MMLPRITVRDVEESLMPDGRQPDMDDSAALALAFEDAHPEVYAYFYRQQRLKELAGFIIAWKCFENALAESLERVAK